MNIIDEIKALAAEMTEIRHELHRHPQLGFTETFASALIQEKLTAWGIPFETGMATTGVVATIESSRNTSGKTIGLRADIDALPIKEQSGVEWKSLNDGFMHACGHDGHTSILLGTAAYLQNHRDEFDGTVKLVFQPAEEGLGGALKMMEDGLFEKHQMEAIFALHNWPDLPLGEVGMCEGPIMASSNSFRMDITGKASHAAFPSKGINAGTMAAEMFYRLSTMLSDLGIHDRTVLSPTVIQAGEAHNIIAGSALVRGTIRTLRPEILETITASIEDLTKTIAQKYKGDVQLTMKRIGVCTMNHPAEVASCAQAARNVFDPDKIHTGVDCAMTSEDFSFMLEKMPGAYIWLGQAMPDENSPHNRSLHNDHYDFNDGAIAPGIALFTNIVRTRLGPAPL